MPAATVWLVERISARASSVRAGVMPRLWVASAMNELYCQLATPKFRRTIGTSALLRAALMPAPFPFAMSFRNSDSAQVSWSALLGFERKSYSGGVALVDPAKRGDKGRRRRGSCL